MLSMAFLQKWGIIISLLGISFFSLLSLLIMHYTYVSKFLLKITANEIVCQDLTQETFLKLIRNIDKFDVYGKASFATYLMTIAKNCYVDYLRKKQ